MTDFNDHFSGNSADYAAYRPRYPAEFVAELAAMAPDHELAWDCATGNGQAAHLVAQHFERVIATDASASQIAHALPHAKVSFHVGREDQSGADDASVSLVTVATALHWLDLDRFYPEVKRVLKPHGVMAAWCYGYASISSEIDVVNHWFGEQRVQQYWPPGRVHIEHAYADLAFPFNEVSLGKRSMTSSYSREEYIGYVSTWSAVAGARKAEGKDPVPELREGLQPLWADGQRLHVTWPLYVRVGFA